MSSPMYSPPYRDATAHEVEAPIEVAKRKLSNGDTLTPEESKLILNSNLSSSQLAPAPKTQTGPMSKFYTPPSPVETTAHPAGTPKWSTAKPQQKPFESTPFSETQKAGYSIPYTPRGGAVAPPAMEVAPKKIPTVAKAVPGPVSSAVAQAAPEAAQALQTPIPAKDVSQKLDSFQKFLKDNPDGLTLANVLDAVGVSLSAYGGTQRQTGLQKRKEAQMQQAQAQTLKAQDFEQQQALKQQEMDQALAMIPAEIEKARAEAQITGDQTRLNLLLEKQAELQNAKLLMPLQTAQSVAIERAKTGIGNYQKAGGTAGLVNKYSGVP